MPQPGFQARYLTEEFLGIVSLLGRRSWVSCQSRLFWVLKRKIFGAGAGRKLPGSDADGPGGSFGLAERCCCNLEPAENQSHAGESPD